VQRADADFVKAEIGAYVEGELKPAMRRVCAHADIVTHTVGEIAGLAVVEQSEARDIVFALTGQDEADVVAFGTEAGLFQALGMSVVVCGPGSIEQAHKPDEYVALDQLTACLNMLEGLGGKLAA
jgi:acetylornithine deacetylase